MTNKETKAQAGDLTAHALIVEVPKWPEKGQ